MQTIDEAYNSASDIYWIAYLLTGDKDLSVRLTLDALDSNEGLQSISTPPALALLRRTVVCNCLAASQAEIAASVQRFAARSPDEGSMNIECGGSIDATISKGQIEQALLRIDIFPRCALLLTVFEGLKTYEAGNLLQSDRELLEAARLQALSDFARNLRSLVRPGVSTPGSLQRVMAPTRLRVSRPSLFA